MRRTRRLGRYHLMERIAYGGMAEIFRGFTFDEEGFRHDVAIKKLLPNFVMDENFIQMLADEFRLVKHLQHDNIAEVYELVELEDDLLIAMEYVDGKDLRSAIDKAAKVGIALEFDDIVYLVAKALDGLHHAHIAVDGHDRPLRIVHRDISPSNILLTYDGQVKLCDFGIAKARSSRVQTKTGIIKGKVKYMSPEQAFGRKLDFRSDVFSMGSVLYELCTTIAPFQAANEIELIFAVRDASPKPPHEANPHIPKKLSEIIMKSMSRSRSARYGSSLSFRNDLLRFLTQYRPNYRRTKLARLMKTLFASAIERDLRILEDYVLDMSPVVDVGRNLIADALGPEATYAKFSPNPTKQVAIDPSIGTSELDAEETRKTEAPPSISGTVSASQSPPEDVPVFDDDKTEISM